LLLLVGLAVQRSRTLRAFSFGAVVAAFALGTATLLMTFSRGAWLAAMAGGATIVALLARSPRMTWSEIARSLMPLMVIVVAVGAVFVVTQWELLRPRLGLTYQGGEVRSVDERETLIAGARALRQLRPWLGVGAGGFSTALYQMAPQAIADYPIFQPVHRVPLLVAAELGPLGSLVWVVVMLAPLGAILVSPRRVAVDGWLAALTAVPVSLFAVGWVEAYPWSSQQGALVTWVVLGLWARHYHSLTS
ncbi:MAG: O-antigen ligase family protein, partial [Anaerolineae bacterium]|nr:O-antigen ligase family protein [Anaerolineae bacterium]